MPYAHPEVYRAYQRVYHAAHKERRRELEAIRRLDPVRREKERLRTQRRKESGELRARSKAYYAKNRLAVLAAMKESYRRSPDKNRLRALRWAKDNHDRLIKNVLAWRKVNPDKVAIYTRNAHIRRRGVIADHVVDWDAIALRDRGICQLCHKKIEKGKRQRSFDHIIPLSLGGVHAEWNLQLAHFRCNARKSNRAHVPSQIRIPI